MISYGQNGEDIVLNRAFADRERGFYIDIGAADPRADNVTKLFYDRGWSGVNVEPQTHHFDDLTVQRPRDVNLHAGISEEAGELTLYRVPEIPGWSTMNPDFRDRYRDSGYEVVEETIPVVTFNEICEQYAPERIDFLKIDVEGHEAKVLAGADLKRFRPVVVVIEATNPHEWEHVFDDNDYRQVLWDGINRFYLAAEHEDLAPLLSSPANILDAFQIYVTHDTATGLAQEVHDLKIELEQVRAHEAALVAEVTMLRTVTHEQNERLQKHPYRHAFGWTRARVTDRLRSRRPSS